MLPDNILLGLLGFLALFEEALVVLLDAAPLDGDEAAELMQELLFHIVNRWVTVATTGARLFVRRRSSVRSQQGSLSKRSL